MRELPPTTPFIRLFLGVVLTAALLIPQEGNCKKASISDVTLKELESLLQSQQFLAVYWYGKNCRTCDRLLGELDKKAPELSESGVSIVKLNDKKTAKKYGILSFPSLSYFKGGSVLNFQGDLSNEEELMNFLVGPQALSMSDQIEEVTSSQLRKLIQSEDFVAVLFYILNHEESSNVMETLELIDDKADKLGVAFVKINDLELVEEYQLGDLPSLVYYRHSAPIVFEGDLSKGDKVLEWIIQNQSTGEEDNVIQDVSMESLEALLPSLEHIAVLFYDASSRKADILLETLEKIDEEAEAKGVHFVKYNAEADREELGSKYGVESLPTLVFFKKQVPNVFDGQLLDGSRVSAWILNQVDSDEIEEVTGTMLDRLVKNSKRLVVLFYESNEPESLSVLGALESIDDDCDVHGIIMVKIDDNVMAAKFGIKNFPSLLYFENSVPFVYTGNLTNEDEVFGWILHQKNSDEIEEINLQILDLLTAEHELVAVLFYEKLDRTSKRILSRIESIDDELDAKSIVFVKISMDTPDPSLESNYGVEHVPSLILFEERTVHLYKGDLTKELKVLSWILSKVSSESEESPPVASEEHVSPEIEKDDPVSTKGSHKSQDKLPVKKSKPETSASKPKPETSASKPKPETSTPKPKPQASASKPKPVTSTSKPRPKKEKSTPPSERKSNEASEASSTSKKTSSNPPKKSTTPKTPFPASSKGNKAPKESKNDLSKEEKAVEDKETRLEKLKMVEKSSNLVGFFYKDLDKVSTKIIAGLKKVEEKLNLKELIFMHLDVNEFPEITVSSIPSLVFFKSGKPKVYEENIMNEDSIYQWVLEEYNLNKDIIEHYASTRLRKLIEENTYVMVFLYSSQCTNCQAALDNLEDIDDDMEAVGVKFVKTDDSAFIKEMGIEALPSIVYFEEAEPSIYDGDPSEESELLTWLLYQMKEDTIENINRELLYKMIGTHEFLAVFFYESDENSLKMLRHLELIDDEVSQYGARIVKINDPLMAKKYGHRDPPGLGYFRKGNYIKYDGDIYDDEEMLDWLTDPNIMEISDQIEKVNTKMFEKLRVRNEHLAVLFYTEQDCKQCQTVLQELENIDDEAEASGIPIVKLEDKELGKRVGVFAYPSIVIFRNFGEEAVIYSGDLKNEETILEWLLVQKDPGNEAIESSEGEDLRRMIDSSDSIAVFIYTQDDRCPTCITVLQGLENIDDDAERHGIDFLKTTDETFAEEMGIHYFPGLVHIQGEIPNIYDGDMEAEEEILDWLIEMKVEHHIELISRPILESMVQKIQYMAVFFIKQNCRTCDQILVELEKIDDECDSYGIQLVRLQDPQLAKRYGIKTFPSLVYFRNGNPLTFEGDLKDELSVLEWLIDDENRELDDEIEAVNFKMLNKLLERSELMAVFFYDQDCAECEVILEELEKIDDEADSFGIDFVKNDDPLAAKHFQVFSAPTLVFFRHGIPITYDGDLLDGEKVLSWLTSQDVFELKDFIEPVNRKLLDKLLDENDFVAVYFTTDNCRECDVILSELEKVDAETEGLDITFVRVNDPRYAKKYGVNKLPSLVYFRRRFPSIFRDNLHNGTEVVEWLRTNRYKTVELDIFMYGIFLMALLFLLYTAFLHFGFKPKPIEKKKEE